MQVLDATDNGPSGPDDLALAEIAQATETLSGCHMVMDVLWTRLSETGNNWRRVYKSLAVIKYLARNGSEYAVRDIAQHNSQISVCDLKLCWMLLYFPTIFLYRLK
ncbi:hypothetical protein RHGRI_016021 [Rhododendron griersonianum]|uniref:ENTH domain-containing protein n=1 Tax=Rhododendron griersonianum TaxID=479676 RepID=A0AAV6JPE9_9ERIC|nr:hypothetical protein RHGRI_016021 [Rhododendron griersonianum]